MSNNQTSPSFYPPSALTLTSYPLKIKGHRGQSSGHFGSAASRKVFLTFTAAYVTGGARELTRGGDSDGPVVLVQSH